MRRGTLTIFALALVISLILGGCSQASTTPKPAISTVTSATTAAKPATSTAAPATTTAIPATSTVAPSTAAPKPSVPASPSPAVNKYGGTFKFLMTDTSTLMGYPPTAAQSGTYYAGFCLESLISATNKPLVYDPLLATRWELAPDKSSYTFYLRKGVKFHDGTDFNAAAVKWNWTNVIAAKRVELAPVSSIDIIDDYTIKVNLKSWNSLVLDAFSRGVTAIISPTAYQKNGEDWINLHPLGTGPFIFAEMERSQYVKYVKNQNYWDKNLPYLDAIQIITVKDPLVKQATLLKGDANGSRELDNTVARAMVDSGKFVAELGAEGNFVINFNSVDPKSMWSNPNMRAALEYALDKETMSNSLGKGFTRASYECLSGIFGAGNNPGTTPKKYDPAKAIQLMKDAGYPNGFKVKMELNQNFNNDWVVAIQGQLAKVGIMIEPDIIPAAAWQERKIQPPAPGVLRYDRARGGPNDMLRTTNEDLATTSAIGFPGVKRPDGWDAILQQALQETDPAKILALMNQLEQKAYGETMYVPVFKQPNTNVWSPNFKSDLGTICYYAGVDGSSIMKYLYQVK